MVEGASLTAQTCRSTSALDGVTDADEQIIDVDWTVHVDVHNRPPSADWLGGLIVPQLLLRSNTSKCPVCRVPARDVYRWRATSESHRQKTSTTVPGNAASVSIATDR
jgi:hypothetical protein